MDEQILRDEILLYLDQSQHLTELATTIFNSENMPERSIDKSSTDPPMRVLLEIDFVTLSELTSTDILANSLINELEKTQNAFCDLILHAARALGFTLRSDQVDIVLRPRSLPPITKDFALGTLRGVLVSRTQLRKYIRSVCYCCPVEQCAGSRGERVSASALGSHLTCKSCDADMKEVTAARIMADEVRGILVDEKALLMTSFDRFQGEQIMFRDDLSGDLELGVSYTVSCSREVNGCHVAWNVVRSVTTPAAGCVPNLVPVSVRRLRSQLCTSSPWQLPAMLATQLAAQTLPQSAFLNLKMSLLLSLASLDSERPVHLLAVGEDSLTSHLLMSQSSRLAPRSVASQCCTVGSSARCDEEGTSWWDAGALQLATTGVCYAGDWAKYRLATQRSPILDALERGSVSSESANVPLRSAVWSYWPADVRKEMTPTNHKNIRTTISVFGLPCLTEAGKEDDEVTRFILEAAINGGTTDCETTIIPEKDLKEYLRAVIGWQVALSEDATQLIRNYFVASRRTRPDCLPVGAINTITALTEAHARLRLSIVADYDDALAALYLYEDTFSSLFGHCCASPAPQRCLNNAQMVDTEMRQFDSWLRIFIKSVLGDDPLLFNSEE